MINSDTRYAYAVGKIRALETRLIGLNQFEKILSADDFQSAVNLLDDKIYPHKNLSKNNFENGLDLHLADIYRLLKDIAVSPELINVFLLKHDFFNLKILLRSLPDLRPGGLSPPRQAGIFSSTELTGMVKNNSYSRFSIVSPSLPDALEKTRKKDLTNRLDIYLQQLLYDVSIETSQKCNSEIVTEFFRKQIDLHNLNDFYRCENQNKSMDFLKDTLLSGGNTDKEIFVKSFQTSALKILQYEKPLGTYDNNFEKRIDDYLTDYIGQSKGISFGIEPLVGYLWAKEIEVKNLRIVFYGKIYNIGKKEVFDQLRKPYVQ